MYAVKTRSGDIFFELEKRGGENQLSHYCKNFFIPVFLFQQAR